MFDFARRNEDPGIAPLRADRLALAMRDMQIRRKRKPVSVLEWLAWLLVVATIIGWIWITP